MPELPEAETIRRDLEATVLGRRIVAVFVHDPAVVRAPAPGPFVAGLKGRTIEAADRRAKYLLLRLDDGRTWALHLSLEARLLLQPADAEIAAGTKLAVGLDDGQELRLVDPVSFAIVALLDPAGLDEVFSLGALGPEPVWEGFDEACLRERLAGRRGMIKPLLLNQRIVAGIGNIYADEALWRAGIHPTRRVVDLDAGQWRGLHRAIVDVIAEGVANRGTSARGGLYRDLHGRKGRHQAHLAVFRRSGEPCLRCGTAIQRSEVGGRATFVCPACQPQPGRPAARAQAAATTPPTSMA